MQFMHLFNNTLCKVQTICSVKPPQHPDRTSTAGATSKTK